MDITQLIGFLVSLIFLLFLFVKQLKDSNARRRNPEEYAKREKEKERQLKDFMRSRSIQIDEDEEEISIRPKKQQKSQHFVQEQNAPKIRPKTPLQQTYKPAYPHALHGGYLAYGTQKEAPSRGYSLVKQQESHTLRNAIVLNEIIKPPRGSPGGAYGAH